MDPEKTKLPQVSSSAPATLAEAPTRVRYQVMGFLCVLSFLTYFDRVCIMQASDAIERDLGLLWNGPKDHTAMSYIYGAFFLAYALFEIPGGWLGDRSGARFTLTRIVLAWSLFTALSGTAVGFLSLLTFRFLFGAGEAGAYPNMARIQSKWLPLEARARAGGMLWLMARWGGAFSPLIFGAMLRGFNSPAFTDLLTSVGLKSLSECGWRFGFWVSGLLGVVWTVSFYRWFRDEPADKPTVNRGELELIQRGRGDGDHGHSVEPGVWGKLLRSRNLWALACLYAFNSMGWGFFITWVPTYFKDVLNVKFEQSAYVSGLPLFFGGISCLVGGTISDWLVWRTGRRRLFRAIFPITGFTIAATSMFGMCFVSTQTLMAPQTAAVVLLCIASAGVDFGQGANWASIVDIGGKYAGTATGFINMVGNLGNALSPIIGEMIFRHFGWPALFATYTASFVLAGSTWAIINPNENFYDEKLQKEEAHLIEELL